jgi:phage terminase large subunit-like protein
MLAQVKPEVALRAIAIVSTRMRRRAELFDTHAWRAIARPEQLPPDGDWHVWYIRGGRGSGKTWDGSHTLAEWAWDHAGDYAAIGPTYADARDTLIEGGSGLLAALGTNRVEVDNRTARYVESWNRSMGELRLRNGSAIWADGADDGALRIQGKNLRGAWADEVGLWRRWRMAWEESLRYAVRLAPARIVATGTPKRGHPLVKALMADETVVKTLLRTIDNAANLDPDTLAEWMRLYGGTTLGRQELEGEIVDDVPGAAWHRDWIEGYRIAPDDEPTSYTRVVVGVDPAATSAEGADETGILVVAAASHERDDHAPGAHEHYFVLRDRSKRATPADWGAIVTGAYRSHEADLIVGETNRGGEMVERVIRSVDVNVAFKGVHATRGKITRAEPVAALYQQGKVHHVGTYPELEDQMCGYVPDEATYSPDRMDALVWALTELAVKDEPGVLGLYRGMAAKRAAEMALTTEVEA